MRKYNLKLVIQKSVRNQITNWLNNQIADDNHKGRLIKFTYKMTSSDKLIHTHYGAELNLTEDEYQRFISEAPSQPIKYNLKRFWDNGKENKTGEQDIFLRENLIKRRNNPEDENTTFNDREQHKLMYYQKATIKDLPEDEIWHLFDSAEDWADHFDDSIPAEVEFNEKLMLETAKTDPELAFKVENAILQTKTN